MLIKYRFSDEVPYWVCRQLIIPTEHLIAVKVRFVLYLVDLRLIMSLPITPFLPPVSSVPSCHLIIVIQIPEAH